MALLLKPVNPSFAAEASGVDLRSLDDAAVTVPPNGGDTEWCDLRAAWDELPDETKRLVEGRTARHFAFHSRIMLGDDKYNETQLKRFPPVERPLVQVHPGSGRKVLFPSA